MQAGSVGRAIFSRAKARISLGLVAFGLCLTQGQTWAAVVCSGDPTISNALFTQQIIGSGPGAWQCGLNVTESGSITVTNTNGVNNMSGITLTTLNNNGQISASVSGNGSGAGIENAGTLTTLNNNGQISASGSGTGIYNAGTITTLNNSNQISAAANAIMNRGTGTIAALNNTGSITGTGSQSYGIVNLLGTITTLNNSGSGSISGVLAGII